MKYKISLILSFTGQNPINEINLIVSHPAHPAPMTNIDLLIEI